jgi:hypothetical protein
VASEFIPEPTPPQPALDARALDWSLLHGVAWTRGAQWVGLLLGRAATPIVARPFTTGDYGVVGVASV